MNNHQTSTHYHIFEQFFERMINIHYRWNSFFKNDVQILKLVIRLFGGNVIRQKKYIYINKKLLKIRSRGFRNEAFVVRKGKEAG